MTKEQKRWHIRRQRIFEYSFNQILKHYVKEKQPELFEEVTRLAAEELERHPKYGCIGNK